MATKIYISCVVESIRLTSCKLKSGVIAFPLTIFTDTEGVL